MPDETETVGRYEYRYLTSDEVRQRFIEELRKAESTHIASTVTAELNSEKAKLMTAEAVSGGKQDNAKLKQATEFKRQALQLRRDSLAFERVVGTIEERFKDIVGTDEDVDAAIAALAAEEKKTRKRVTTTVEESGA